MADRGGYRHPVTMLSNRQIAQPLFELADLLQFTGRAYHPARAYRRAALIILQLPLSVAQLAREGRATEVPGIGASTAAKILELCDTGTIGDLERMRERVPTGLMLLSRFPRVGKSKAEQIWQALEPADLDDVHAAAQEGRLSQVQGVGPKTVEAVLEGIHTLQQQPEEIATTMLRSHAQRAVDTLRALLESVLPGQCRFQVCGEFARGAELVDVVDVLVVAEDRSVANAVIRERLDARGWHTASEEAHVDECVTFALQGASGAGVRIHVSDRENEAQSLLWAVGPESHALAVIELGTAEPTDRGAANEGAADAPLYERAGLQYVPFELRDRPEAIALARAREIPRLVTVADLKAELHCHSNWSDGRTTIAEMAHAAIKRGYSYMAITDHSQSLRIVRGLGAERLLGQARELAEVRRGLPNGFELLQGIEMEILSDGTLDLPDDVLEQLDWVVASIHVRQRQPRDEITRRMERAMRNPLVDCIGHPTSRLLLRRPKTQLDTDRLIELAAETGTFLEINSSTDRLDLDAETAGRAAQAGVLICINSDAHGPETLRLVEHGVAIARHAALTPGQVLNTRSWTQVRSLQKRNRG